MFQSSQGFQEECRIPKMGATTQGTVLTGYSFSDFLDDPKYFRNLLNESKLLCFPELGLSREQNKQVCAALGYSSDRQNDENHAMTMGRKGWPNAPKQVLVQWHLENLDHEQPPILAGWNMTKFICPKGHGRTGFVNMAEMYKKFKPDIPFEYVFVRMEKEVEQLKEQVARGKREFDIGNVENTEERTVDNLPVDRWASDRGYHPPIIDSVSAHPITGELVLRYMVDSHAVWMPISDVDIEKEKISYDFTLIKEIRNPDNQFWWDWTEGDFLLADLFCMMHSVMGGFTSEQRVLDVVFSNKALPL